MGFGGGDSGEEVRPLMNVVPFIDIMLVLLVVFMLAVPALQKSSADQNPADKSSEVSDTGAAGAASHEICVSRGSVTLDSVRTDRESLLRSLSDPALPMSDTITLSAAPGTPWSEVLPVMGIITESGRSKAAFSVCGEGGD